MGWYPWSVPDEIICFMTDQFERFGVSQPSDRCLDEVAAYVLSYVAKRNYYPRSPEEAAQRFYEDPPRGLSEPECQALVPEIEIRLKLGLHECISDVQLHLCLWAALLYCWSEGGFDHVNWFKKYDIDEEARPGFPVRLAVGR